MLANHDGATQCVDGTDWPLPNTELQVYHHNSARNTYLGDVEMTAIVLYGNPHESIVQSCFEKHSRCLVNRRVSYDKQFVLGTNR